MTDSRSQLAQDPTRLGQARRRRPSPPASRHAVQMALLAALAGAVAAVIVAIVLAHVLQVAVR